MGGTRLVEEKMFSTDGKRLVSAWYDGSIRIWDPATGAEQASWQAPEKFTEWLVFFFSSRRRHTRFSRDWSSDVCSSDLRGCDGNPRSGSPWPAGAPAR